MLNCTVCGHDNFPVTSAEIYGFAHGSSLEMASRCHKCGAKIAEICSVCDRLHPLNTTYCSVEGINIQALQNEQVKIADRLRAFFNMDDFKKLNTKQNIATIVIISFNVIVFIPFYLWILKANSLSDPRHHLLLPYFGIIFGQGVAFFTFFQWQVKNLWRKNGNKEELVDCDGEWIVPRRNILNSLKG